MRSILLVPALLVPMILLAAGPAQAQVCGNLVVEPGEQCDDGNTTPGDFCSATCQWEDLEMAAGPDGVCDTYDDNLDLFGPDGACGTLDDLVGDGVLDYQDNCQSGYNPSQVDADGDFVGAPCDQFDCPRQEAYVADMSDLLRVQANGTTFYRASGFVDLEDVALNPGKTRAYVTDMGAGSLVEVELATGATRTVASMLVQPTGVAIDPTGVYAYVAERLSGALDRIDIAMGTVTPVAVLDNPTGVAVDAMGSFAYVAELFTGDVRRVDLATGGTSPVASGLAAPRGVALNASGTTLYVVENAIGQLTAIDLGTGIVTPVGGFPGYTVGIGLDPDGRRAWTAGDNAGINIMDLSTGAVTSVPAPTNTPRGIDLGPQPPLRMQVPLTSFGEGMSSLNVPIDVDDVTGRNVLSTDIVLEFNPAVLAVTGVSLGPLTSGMTSGCTLTSNLSVPGRVVISIFCTNPLVGAGTLADVAFDVVGGVGQGTPIQFVSGFLNEGNPASCLAPGNFRVPGHIQGTIRYYRDDVMGSEPSIKPVAGAATILDLASGPASQTVSVDNTACDGTYDLTAYFIPDDYTSYAFKLGDDAGAIDPFDAALNAQSVVNLTTLTPNQQIAADVTGNGTLTSFDSAEIARYAVGLITKFPVAQLAGGSDWSFLPVDPMFPGVVAYPRDPSMGRYGGVFAYLPLSGTLSGLDFLAILYGDVSGNWQGPGCPESSAGTKESATVASGESTQPAGSAFIEIPDLSAVQGDVVSVPITVRGAAEALAVYLDLTYDRAILRLEGVEKGTAASAFNLMSNLATPGRARLAMYGITGLGSDGVIVVANFRVVGRAGRSPLRLPAYTINEGRIPAQVEEGSVRVRPRPGP